MSTNPDSTCNKNGENQLYIYRQISHFTSKTKVVKTKSKPDTKQKYQRSSNVKNYGTL